MPWKRDEKQQHLQVFNLAGFNCAAKFNTRFVDSKRGGGCSVFYFNVILNACRIVMHYQPVSSK